MPLFALQHVYQIVHRLHPRRHHEVGAVARGVDSEGELCSHLQSPVTASGEQNRPGWQAGVGKPPVEVICEARGRRRRPREDRPRHSSDGRALVIGAAHLNAAQNAGQKGGHDRSVARSERLAEDLSPTLAPAHAKGAAGDGVREAAVRARCDVAVRSGDPRAVRREEGVDAAGGGVVECDPSRGEGRLDRRSVHCRLEGVARAEQRVRDNRDSRSGRL
mmetsp:Transcript_22086/g.71123  ORF Transcript_22086/g.71123 Transcript_22086/m.71123 type:complete len:219 (+) Transcript_22086:1016-1672(+)